MRSSWSRRARSARQSSTRPRLIRGSGTTMPLEQGSGSPSSSPVTTPGLGTQGQLQDPAPAAVEGNALPPAHYLPAGVKGTDVVQLPFFGPTLTRDRQACPAGLVGYGAPGEIGRLGRTGPGQFDGQAFDHCALYRHLDLGAGQRRGVDRRNRGRNVQGHPYRAHESRDHLFDVPTLQVGPVNAAALSVRPVELPGNGIQGDLHRLANPVRRVSLSEPSRLERRIRPPPSQ